jgi:heat shock protein HslJ
MLLLVSAAAAIGNDIDSIVYVSEETSDNCITGATLAQMSDIEANLLGNGICAFQGVDFEIEDSSVTGLNDGKTNLIQMGDLTLNDTGCGSYDSQFMEFAQGENYVSIGNITQRGIQSADVAGNDNYLDQCTEAFAGVWEEYDECEVGSPNRLTMSDLKQVSILDASVDGNTNDAYQKLTQYASDNCLTTSKLYEQAAIAAAILGNSNNPCGEQEAIQGAAFNALTDSWINEMVCMDEQITGNINNVDQYAFTGSYFNRLTNSTILQDNNIAFKTLGNDNLVCQSAELLSEDNLATFGHIVQESNIDINA